MMENFYEGYEGNPELDIYTLIGDEKVGIQMWDGYFDEIMTKIEPGNEGWQSLAYYYNMNEGWYDDSPWKIPNNTEALNQLETVELRELDDISRKILTSMIELIRNNIDKVIYIEYS